MFTNSGVSTVFLAINYYVLLYIYLHCCYLNVKSSLSIKIITILFCSIK